MLERLHLKNVGPAPELEMEFAPRVNLITGDNGLGKSFLLDVAWWVLTRRWLSEVNPKMTNADMLRPNLGVKEIPSITSRFSASATIKGTNTWVERTDQFNFQKQMWSAVTRETAKRTTDTFVLQFRVSGDIGVFDPAKGHFAFRSKDVWDGLFREEQRWGSTSPLQIPMSNGLIRDWEKWQLENTEVFQQFKAALKRLSPDEDEKLVPGKLARVSLDDARDIPTLIMPYGQEVPVIHASAGIRRVLTFAYILVWTWQEHLLASKLKRQEPAREIVLLIDELEQHLHPRWQRVILPALLETVKELMKSDVRVQIIATTHSPMVLASLEPLYEDTQDAWFDLNLVNGTVTLERMPWRKRGDASAWLTSEAFDLPSSGSLDREGAMDRAAKVMASPKLTKKSFLEHDQALRGVLGETDPFWIRWRFMGEKKGWL
jgi:AAA domain, putative AbiEii toxin, Type IV TA system